MVRKALALGVLLLALAPAAHLAWVARDMPHFGHLHDDSIYFVCAKSIAQSRGYRILSLPAEPFQTKYPPLWPLMLAVVWKLDPRFPENLPWAMALAWVMLPAFVALAWRWFRRTGFDIRLSTTLCATIALSPCAIVLSTTVMSDLVFSVALLAAVQWIESAGRSALRALGAGALAAVAYLIKTAALPLAIAGPLWLALRRKYRAACLMLCAMLPAVAAWTLWSRAHMTHASDLVSLYYTNYLGYQIYNVGWRDLPLFMWKNLDGGISAGLAGVLYIAIVWNVRALSHEFPLMVSQHRMVLASNRLAFAWIAQHVPAGNFYAYDDPVFYLYTGHHAASLPVPPLPFYHQDRESILRPFRTMPAFAREQHLDYVLFTAADFHRDLPEAERAEARRILAAEKAFEPVYRSALSSIFAVSPLCAIPDTNRVEIRTVHTVKTPGP